MLESLRQYHPALPDIVALVILLLAAVAAYGFGKQVLVVLAHKFASRSEQTWDDALIEHKVPSRLAQMLPVFIIYIGIDLLPRFEDAVEAMLLKATGAYMILVVTFTLTALLGTANSIYESYPAWA